MRADHVLIVLSLFIIGMVATQTVWVKNDTRVTVEHECELFYSAIGHDAEHQCEVEMLRQHLHTSAGAHEDKPL